jgi:hypothetical protein
MTAGGRLRVRCAATERDANRLSKRRIEKAFILIDARQSNVEASPDGDKLPLMTDSVTLHSCACSS